MPVLYNCRDCKLTFSIGGYHGHEVFGMYAGGYDLACYNCGLQYNVVQGNTNRGPEYFYTYGIEIESYAPSSKVQLLKKIRTWKKCSIHQAKNIVQSIPFIIDEINTDLEKTIKELSRLGITSKKVPVSKWKNENYGQPIADSILSCNNKLTFHDEWKQTEPTIEIHRCRPMKQRVENYFSDIPCYNCEHIGMIKDIHPTHGSKCPHCKNHSITSCGGYIT